MHTAKRDPVHGRHRKSSQWPSSPLTRNVAVGKLGSDTTLVELIFLQGILRFWTAYTQKSADAPDGKLTDRKYLVNVFQPSLSLSLSLSSIALMWLWLTAHIESDSICGVISRKAPLHLHSHPCWRSSVCGGRSVCAIFSKTQRRLLVIPTVWSCCHTHEL